jgi:hypothetical protein
VEFGEELLGSLEDKYQEISGSTEMSGVISVYDVSDRDAVLYSEISSQECFLGFRK